MAADTGL